MHTVRPRHTGSSAVLATAAIVIMGAQLIRVFIPIIGWYLRDVVSVGTFNLIPYAVTPFLAAFLLPLIDRLLGARGALWLAAAGVAAARVAEQLTTDPAVDLWIAMAGVAMFLWVLPLLVGFTQDRFAAGVLLGLAADTALKGATRTLDLSWIEGIWPLALVVALAGGALIAVHRLTSQEAAPSWPGRGAARALIVIGPVLAIEWMVLQNQGWIATQTGWSSGAALLLIATANAAGLLIINLAPVSRRGATWSSMTAGGLLLAVTIAAFSANGAAFGLIAAGGIVAGATLLAAVDDREPRTEQVARSGMAIASGMLLFLILTLVYFITIDLPLFGLTNRSALIILGGVAAASALIVSLGHGRTRAGSLRWPAIAAGFLLVVPLGLLISNEIARGEDPPAAQRVTVMAYNLHSAFDGTGVQDPEALAQVMEESGADVIGLQEVSRGWFLNGGTDLVAWLGARLDMPHGHFVGAADPAWGNAILSRYPLDEIETGLLPQGLIPHQRSYQIATVMVDDETSFLLINTHLQQINDSSIPDEERERDLGPLHLEQLGTVVEAWGGRPRTVLTGDLNAQPGWVQMDYLLGEGFVDGLAMLTPREAYTSGYWSNNGVARWRVDWLIHTPDLEVRSARVIQDDTSDHYPQVVEFSVEP